MKVKKTASDFPIVCVGGWAATMDYFIEQVQLKSHNPYGFKATFNATHPDRSNSAFGWVSP
jgi:hypothetical protein